MELLFSQPKSTAKDSAEAFSVSVVLHVIAAVGAVYLTINPPQKIIAEEHIIIPTVQQEQAQHDVAPPPPPPPNQKPISLEDIPKGFQTLTMPTVVPPDIPPPTAGPETNESDFSGEGVEGGLAKGRADPSVTKVVTAEDLAVAPSFTPYTVAPVLKNREEIADLLVRMYPPMLRDAAIGGVVGVWVFVDAQGTVKRSLVKETSGLQPLDSAAIKVTNRMRFTPAQNRDVRVPVWVAIPINFTVK